MKHEKGAVEVFLPKEFFNSLIGVLSCFVAADETNKYAFYAARLKEKMLRHSRRFTHKEEEFSVTYFYENEAALLIKLCAIYINSGETMQTDYFSELKK